MHDTVVSVGSWQDSGAAAVSDVDIMERFYRLSLTLFEERQNISETWATQDRSGGYLDSVQVCSACSSST